MKGKTILLVEDNPDVMRNNKDMLTDLGVKVLTAETLAEARTHLFPINYSLLTAIDAAVIDIMLPDGSGLEFLKEIRKAESYISNLPVLLLTAKGETEDMLHGFSVGADDYLAKPYLMKIFAARLKALLRRSSNVTDSVTIGCLRFDLITNGAFYKDNDLLLTQKEFALLYLLAQNEGKMLRAKYLYENVWKQPFEENSAVKSHIFNLKKKLSAIESDFIIDSTWGEGYSLVKGV